jgi:preprotein translocase subunit SecD
VLRSLKFRAILILALLFIAIIFLLPNLVELTGGWKEYLPSEKIHLGLDLQGGMRLLYQLDTVKMMDHIIDRNLEQLKEGMIREGIRFMGLDKKADGIEVVVKSDQREKLYDFVAKQVPDMKVTASRVEGDNVYLDLSIAPIQIKSLKGNAVERALETIRNRIDQSGFGVREPVITQQGESNILVELPGVKDPERALELIGRTAQLEFKLVDEGAAQTGAGAAPAGDEVLPMRQRSSDTGGATASSIVVKKQALITGDMVTDAQVRIGGGQFHTGTQVDMEFSSEGARVFDKVTGENVGKRLAIVLDNVVYSAPVINERISGGRAQITGSFTVDEAKDLANVLRNGALPAPVNLIQNTTVGPTLGQDSIRKGVEAAILGGILIIAFMVFYYKGSGIVADVALFLNLIYLLGAFAAFQATMTLPGIAGIILTMGMGVDTNVLIFERIREELRSGKTVRAAVDGGYSKAWVTILDAHITTLITTIILFIFGTGPIKGFAVTLAIGIIINLFIAVFGSKAIFDWIIARYKPRSLSI